MKKLVLLITLTIIFEAALAYDADEYASLLDWEKKWQKITTNAINGYVERGEKIYPSNFSNAQIKQASKEIKKALEPMFTWSEMKDVVTSGFRAHCGDELLDVMVDLYSGVEYSQEDREVIAVAYGDCGPLALQGLMKKVWELIEGFADEEEKILSEIASY